MNAFFMFIRKCIYIHTTRGAHSITIIKLGKEISDSSSNLRWGCLRFIFHLWHLIVLLANIFNCWYMCPMTCSVIKVPVQIIPLHGISQGIGLYLTIPISSPSILHHIVLCYMVLVAYYCNLNCLYRAKGFQGPIFFAHKWKQKWIRTFNKFKGNTNYWSWSLSSFLHICSLSF